MCAAQQIPQFGMQVKQESSPSLMAQQMQLLLAAQHQASSNMNMNMNMGMSVREIAAFLYPQHPQQAQPQGAGATSPHASIAGLLTSASHTALATHSPVSSALTPTSTTTTTTTTSTTAGRLGSGRHTRTRAPIKAWTCIQLDYYCVEIDWRESNQPPVKAGFAFVLLFV